MCLIVKPNAKPLIAEEDIYCYKTLYCPNEVANRPYSVYKRYVYKLNTPNPIVTLTKLSHIECNGDTQVAVFTIDIGYHSWKSYFHAWRQKGKLSSSILERVFLCKIPKGSTYYEGMQFDYQSGYASDNIIILKRITLIEGIIRWITKKFGEI